MWPRQAESKRVIVMSTLNALVKWKSHNFSTGAHLDCTHRITTHHFAKMCSQLSMHAFTSRNRNFAADNCTNLKCAHHFSLLIHFLFLFPFLSMNFIQNIYMECVVWCGWRWAGRPVDSINDMANILLYSLSYRARAFACSLACRRRKKQKLFALEFRSIVRTCMVSTRRHDTNHASANGTSSNTATYSFDQNWLWHEK